jgi:hypothetical protein
MKKVLGIFLGIVAGLIVAVFLAGFLLPETYRAQVQFRLGRPPEEVWAAVADYQKHPLGGSMRKSTQALPDVNGLPAWTEDLGDTRLRIETRETRPPNFVRLYVKDEVVSMDGHWEIRIERAEGGSRVTAANEIHVRTGTWHAPIFRVMLSLMDGGRRGLEEYSTHLAASFGEKPQFAAQ